MATTRGSCLLSSRRGFIEKGIHRRRGRIGGSTHLVLLDLGGGVAKALLLVDQSFLRRTRRRRAVVDEELERSSASMKKPEGGPRVDEELERSSAQDLWHVSPSMEKPGTRCSGEGWLLFYGDGDGGTRCGAWGQIGRAHV